MTVTACNLLPPPSFRERMGSRALIVSLIIVSALLGSPAMSDVIFQLSTTRPSALLGERVIVEATITNGTAGAIQVPDPRHGYSSQPVYRLRGPDGTARAWTPRGQLYFEVDHEGPLLTIEPGQRWKTSFGLDQARLPGPGDYALDATLDWGGLHLSAAPLQISVRAPALTGLAVHRDASEPSYGQFALMIESHGDRHRAVSTQLIEEQGLRARPLYPFAVLSQRPLSLVPVTVNDSKFGWTVAIGQRKDGLLVAPDEDLEIHVASPAPLRECLTALGTIQGGARCGLHIFCVLDGQNAPLGHAHIDDIEKPRSTELRSILSLGPGYVAADAAVGSARRGSPMVVAAAAIRGESAHVTLLRVTATGEIAGRAEATVPGSTPIAPLAVHIDSTGRVDAAFVSHAKGASSLELIQVTARLDHLTPVVHRTPIPGERRATQIMVRYGDVEHPHLPGVFLQGPGTQHLFFRPGATPVTVDEVFRPHDMLALHVARGWYLLINDGTRLRWVPLVEAPRASVPRTVGDPILP